MVNSVVMIHVLSDDPDGGEQLEELGARLGDPELRQLNTTVFDGKKLSCDELVAACEAMPFLSERRLVVVRGLLARFEQKAAGGDQREEEGAEAKEPQLARQLRDYLPKLPDSVELVFVEALAISKRNPVHKALTTAGARFAQTPPLKGEALGTWIVRRVKAKGGRIAPAAGRLLAAYGGTDLRALDQDLDKLVAYAGNGEIDVAAVQQLVDAAREHNVYKMGDAMAEGHVAVALAQFRELLDEGSHPLYILTMMARHFRLLLQIKDLRERGLRGEGIAAKVRLPTFVVERLSSQLRRYPKPQQLEQVHRRLLEADAAMKTGKGDLTMNLELLIAELAVPPRAIVP